MTHYHFIGIGGTGLSAIAHVLLDQGHLVSGSDKLKSPQVNELLAFGVEITIGHFAKNIIGANFVIRSSAIPDDNPEVMAARKANIPVFKRSDFLGEITRGKTVLAIAGTHGKTTTTAMLAWTLTLLKQDPSYIIGGVSKNLKTNGHAGKGRYFVIEADEYDGMFFGLQPEILVVTSIEHDHPDNYPTPQSYMDAFIKLTHQINPGGVLLLCKDHPQAEHLRQYAPAATHVLSYGTKPDADYFATDILHLAGCGAKFAANGKNGELMKDIQLQVPGEHNVINSMAIVAVTSVLGLEIEQVKQPLESFLGTGRRFDILGCENGVTVIDDYAHHPTEIRATLSAARCRFPQSPLWVVWQPHTYSRTQTLLPEFINAFENCDHVIVTEIFRSREKEQEYSAAEVIPQMQHPDAKFMSDFSSIIEYLLSHMKRGDILLVLSAGDADQISAQVLAQMKNKGGKYA